MEKKLNTNDGRVFVSCPSVTFHTLQFRQSECETSLKKLFKREEVSSLTIMSIFVKMISMITEIDESEISHQKQIRNMIDLIPEHCEASIHEVYIRRFLRSFSDNTIKIQTPIKKCFEICWDNAEREFQSNGWDLAFLTLDEAFNHLALINGYTVPADFYIGLDKIRPRLKLFLLTAES